MTDRDKIIAATCYADEAQLLGWSETDKGRKVIFLLSPQTGERHPFAEFRPGKRFMLAATLIGDNELPEPVKAPALKQAEAEPAQRPHYKRSQIAFLKLQDKDFKAWLVDTYWTGKEEVGDYDALLKRALGIASKSELDIPDGLAAERWDSMLASFDYRGRA